jgi:ElaB/YqjD/DUF883 family membrane-anchored ribosome-binding protein
VIPTNVHDMARRIKQLETENESLRAKVAAMENATVEKLRSAFMKMLGEAKENIKQRELDIQRLMDDGCPHVGE